jgi:endonuclease YncB( thermonuclease family)
VFCLVAITDLSGGTSRLLPAASTTAAPPPSTTAPPVVTIATAAERPGSAAVVTGPVTEVVDGDTLEVAGERVRVLGIDACELGTTAGTTARNRAVALIGGRTVALRREPGVDRDRSGRALRYVEIGGRDFGLAMVDHPDTGVSAGDVDPAYLAQLRAADADGRTCR